MPADRRFVQLVGPGRLDPPPALAVEHVELGVERLVGMRLQRLVERVALVDALGIEVQSTKLRPTRSSDGRPKTWSTAGLMYFTRPDCADHHDDVGGVLHERAEPGLALGRTTRAWFVSSTRRVMRHATPMAATPVITASTTAALEPESSRMTTAGAANNAAPRTTIRARPWRTRPASPASQSSLHRRVHHRRREQEVRDRPQHVERAAVGVGAVGDQPGVDHVGDQHRRRARRTGATPQASSAAA